MLCHTSGNLCVLPKASDANSGYLHCPGGDRNGQSPADYPPVTLQCVFAPLVSDHSSRRKERYE